MAQISLIMPVYNAENFLKKSVTGLLEQTFSDFELILVDDGSKDGSGVICDGFAATDSRVKVIHQENSGAGAARNAGLDAATAPYLMFPDADDTMEPDMLEMLLRTITESGAQVVLCGFTESYFGRDFATGKRTAPTPVTCEGQEAVRAFFMDWYPDGMAGYLWNKIYRAAVIRENGIRFTDMRRYQDGAFNVMVFDKVDKMVAISDCLYHYGLNDVDTAYAKFPKNKLELMCAMLEVYQRVLDTWEQDKSVAQERLLSFYLRGAVSCIDCLFNPAWRLDAAGRKAYLRQLTEQEQMREMLPRRGCYGRYPDMILRLLAQHRFLLIRQAVYLKMVLKRHAQSLFLLLKGKR